MGVLLLPLELRRSSLPRPGGRWRRSGGRGRSRRGRCRTTRRLLVQRRWRLMDGPRRGAAGGHRRRGRLSRHIQRPRAGELRRPWREGHWRCLGGRAEDWSWGLGRGLLHKWRRGGLGRRLRLGRRDLRRYLGGVELGEVGGEGVPVRLGPWPSRARAPPKTAEPLAEKGQGPSWAGRRRRRCRRRRCRGRPRPVVLRRVLVGRGLRLGHGRPKVGGVFGRKRPDGGRQTSDGEARHERPDKVGLVRLSAPVVPASRWGRTSRSRAVVELQAQQVDDLGPIAPTRRQSLSRQNARRGERLKRRRLKPVQAIQIQSTRRRRNRRRGRAKVQTHARSGRRAGRPGSEAGAAAASITGVSPEPDMTRREAEREDSENSKTDGRAEMLFGRPPDLVPTRTRALHSSLTSLLIRLGLGLSVADFSPLVRLSPFLEALAKAHCLRNRSCRQRIAWVHLPREERAAPVIAENVVNSQPELRAPELTPV